VLDLHHSRPLPHTPQHHSASSQPDPGILLGATNGSPETLERQVLVGHEGDNGVMGQDSTYLPMNTTLSPPPYKPEPTSPALSAIGEARPPPQIRLVPEMYPTELDKRQTASSSVMESSTAGYTVQARDINGRESSPAVPDIAEGLEEGDYMSHMARAAGTNGNGNGSETLSALPQSSVSRPQPVEIIQRDFAELQQDEEDNSGDSDGTLWHVSKRDVAQPGMSVSSDSSPPPTEPNVSETIQEGQQQRRWFNWCNHYYILTRPLYSYIQVGQG
jgi:hypothetical protein